jgi:Protein of unknown function (DUF2865)
MPRIVPLAGTDGSPQSVTIGEMLVNADWIAKALETYLATRHIRGGSQPCRQIKSGQRAPTANIQVALRPAVRRVLFPISYSTPGERFAGDAKQCEQRCPSRSRLFVHRNPGEDVDDMVDLQGRG